MPSKRTKFKLLALVISAGIALVLAEGALQLGQFLLQRRAESVPDYGDT